VGRRHSFEDFTLDEGTRTLCRSGAELKLSPKAFQLLVVLLGASPEALSRQDLLDRVWGGDVVVEEGNLSSVINEIRTVLGDDARRPRFVRTVHSFGYGFVAPLCLEETHAQSPRCRLHWPAGRHVAVSGEVRTWEGGQVPLTEGEYVIGSDPGASVWLDAHGVSKRHARFRVTHDQVSLEDLGSKNGTYIGQTRIQMETALREGDEIRLGLATVTVRFVKSTETSTDTV
jgi:DNA-binding winged helix-turn-helix (wHTH) protein